MGNGAKYMGLFVLGLVMAALPAHAQDARSPIPEIAPLDRFAPAIEAWSVTYRPQDIVFSPEIAARLDNLARRLRGTVDIIELVGHSGNDQTSTQDAIKLSLMRTMMIRTYLINNGVDGDHVDLKALSQASDGGHPDRVDIRQITRE
jgi:outer membrane protein OmpA-like peptidoglycan-associated protein